MWPRELASSSDLSGVVDLRALQLVGVIDVDGLPLGVEVDGRDGRFAMTVAGLLGATKRKMRFRADGGRIDVHNTGEEVAHGCEGAIHISRVNRRGQAVGHAIGDLDGLLEASDRNHRDYRAKNLLLRDAHLRMAIAEHGRLMEPAFRERAVAQTMAAGEQLGALVLPDS